MITRRSPCGSAVVVIQRARRSVENERICRRGNRKLLARIPDSKERRTGRRETRQGSLEKIACGGRSAPELTVRNVAPTSTRETMNERGDCYLRSDAVAISACSFRRGFCSGSRFPETTGRRTENSAEAGGTDRVCLKSARLAFVFFLWSSLPAISLLPTRPQGTICETRERHGSCQRMCRRKIRIAWDSVRSPGGSGWEVCSLGKLE